MERYGLNEDQIHLQVNIYTSDLGLGNQILADQTSMTYNVPELKPFQNCEGSPSGDIDYLWVHRKDGFYGSYVNADKEVDDDE
jgi:hypothetical protein